MTQISTHQSNQFSSHILKWFKQHGRHHLPWQREVTAYRVWLSEIMLQQTQVITVIAYYERFLMSFPDIQSLANASVDDVLALWSGLGYYARARHLHKTAQMICNEFSGSFPNNLKEMQTLPGIGRSTAAAILTFSMQQSHAILDGNVKRVIARHYEVKGWSGSTSTLNELWQLSESLTPQKQTAQYNQAMMDMGATVCTRTKPKCQDCCLKQTCAAFKNNSWSRYPSPKPKKAKPKKEAFLIMLKHKKTVFFEKRIPSGIWGGLWSFPEFNTEEKAKQWLKKQGQDGNKDTLEVFSNELLHRFSHYDFMIHLIVADVTKITLTTHEKETHLLNRQQLSHRGLPTPIKSLLKKHF